MTLATEWDADVTEDVPDEKVTWRAVDGREGDEVCFEKVAAGSTKVTLRGTFILFTPLSGDTR